MKSMLNLVFILLATVSFCQNDLQAEIQTLESEIKSLEKEISSLESQRDQELNAQQLLIDEKQKEENQQQQVVDQINDKIKDLNTKLSNYAVNQNQISAYKELSDKELYVEHLQDKKLIKFIEAIKESNTILYSDYRMVYSSKTLYILNNQGKSRFQKIEFSEKQQKQFNKLLEKEILLPVGAVRASYLKDETGLDEQYFTLFDKKNNQETLLEKESSKLNDLKSQKRELAQIKGRAEVRFNEKIDIQLYEFNSKKKGLSGILQKINNQEFLKRLKTCTIGLQTWTATNLNLKYFRNGDPIKEVKSMEEWADAISAQEPAFCYPNFDENYDPKCGLLYNKYVVTDARKIAPEGWHLPSKDEISANEFYISNFFNKESFLNNEYLKSNGLKSNGWPTLTIEIPCPKCIDWNDSYRNARGCDRCKNNLTIGTRKVSMSGNNSSGFNCVYCPRLYFWEFNNSGGFSNTEKEYALHDLNYGKDISVNYWTSDNVYFSCRSIYDNDHLKGLATFGYDASTTEKYKKIRDFNKLMMTYFELGRKSDTFGFQIRLIKDE